MTVTVVAPTPLPGLNLPIEQLAAPVQTATSKEMDATGAIDLSGFMNRRLSGVFVNEIQGNPFQPDISYRGYTASPLLGTPQGISVYMDGVRLNQPFGDVVSWDLIPRMAVASTTLMPGSNPLFGLNTLGGALALQTKDGRTSRGLQVNAEFGAANRRSVDFEDGGSRGATGMSWYIAGNGYEDDGWRVASPSIVRQLFGKLGWIRGSNVFTLTTNGASNKLTGNGLQEMRLLDRDYKSVYTVPDQTNNVASSVTFNALHATSDKVTYAANGYYRYIRTRTLNGDLNDDSLDQSLYQPTAAEQNALTAAGYTGFPTSGATAANTPFPSWRCIANVLLDDEPGETCNGLLNRTGSVQHNAGGTAQATVQSSFGGVKSQFIAGGGYDESRMSFNQGTQLGYLNPDRSITGLNAFADGGLTGGTVDGEPLDNRVNLTGRVRTASLFATDTFSWGDAVHVTASGRYNRTAVHNRDLLTPGGGTGSLDSDSVYQRLNPAIGVTLNPSRRVNVYADYDESSRAPTSIEVGCADPDAPCKLPDAVVGDPPLDQVVARTIEGGLRSRSGSRVSWTVDLFRSNNDDDILFVASEQTGFGYFRNFGQTRRQGIEIDANTRAGRATIGAGYTFLSATYQSAETIDGAANSTNDAALDGMPGLEGTIDIAPGDRIPLIPRHTFKAYAEVSVTSRIAVDVDAIATSGSFARGNENNQHVPDGIYYLGPGSIGGYGIVNLGVHYRVVKHLQISAQIDNVLDRKYFTAAQLGATGILPNGHFIARPLPAEDGDFPLVNSTFYAPGAPRQAYVSARVTF